MDVNLDYIDIVLKGGIVYRVDACHVTHWELNIERDIATLIDTTIRAEFGIIVPAVTVYQKQLDIVTPRLQSGPLLIKD